MGHKANDREDDATGEHRGKTVDARDDQCVAQHVVVELVVGGKGNPGPVVHH